MTEIEKIKKTIEEMSMEEFEKIMYDCGIESIKPSIDSSYVRCMKRNLAEKEYRKSISIHTVKEEYFDVDVLEQEVA